MKQKLLLLVALLCCAFSPLSSSAATATVGEHLPIIDGKSAVFFAHLYNKGGQAYLYETTSGTLAFQTTVPNKKWRIDYNAENKTVTLSYGEKSIYMYYDDRLFIYRDAVNYGGSGTQGDCNLHATYTQKDASNGYDYIFYIWHASNQTGLLLEKDYSSNKLVATREDMGTLLPDNSPYVPSTAVARWRLVDVEGGTDQANLTVSGTAKYGTFVAPFQVTLPSGVTAYTVEGYDETTCELDLQEVSGGTLAANTAVIVENNTGATISKDYYGNPTGGKNANSGEYLVGTYEITPAPVGSFLLQYRTEPEPEAIFLYVDGSETLNCGKNRAYLTGIAPAGVKSLNLSGLETSIEVVKAPDNIEEDTAIYDLSGRRLSQKPARGLYIQNGKKILVK